MTHDKVPISTVTLVFNGLQKATNKGLSSLNLTMRKSNGLASFPIDVGGAGCTPPKDVTNGTALQLTSTVAALEHTSGNTTRSLRVTLALPNGHAWAIALSAKNGVITKVTPTAPIKGFSLTTSLTSDGATLTSSPIVGKDPVKVGLDLELRNLTNGSSLTLTATATLAKSDSGNKNDAINQPDPVSLTIPISDKQPTPDAKPPAGSPPFAFTSSVTQIEPSIAGPTTGTATVRVLVGFPVSGKPSSISITASKGELTGASITDSTPPANVSLTMASGTVTVATSVAPSKGGKPFGIDLTLRNLVAGNTLMLKATAKPSVSGKMDPISIEIVAPTHTPLTSVNP
jgi:hypothetical protein